jgi:hypothetical protein
MACPTIHEAALQPAGEAEELMKCFFHLDRRRGTCESTEKSRIRANVPGGSDA